MRIMSKCFSAWRSENGRVSATEGMPSVLVTLALRFRQADGYVNEYEGGVAPFIPEINDRAIDVRGAGPAGL